MPNEAEEVSEKKKKRVQLLKSAGENLVRFAFSLLFVSVYQLLFGVENTLAGVAISVAITMLPVCDTGVRTISMAGMIVLLFAGCGLVSQLALVSPWLALPVNFSFVLLIMALCSEPPQIKLYINFMLGFVFCQATPVPMELFGRRMLGLLTGSTLVAVISLIWWKRKGLGKDGRNLTGQLKLCASDHGFILRMAAGIAMAMFAASILGLKKPLWISIVVMSLTQMDFRETFQRIKYRTLGTLVGIVLFILFFRILIPAQYAMIGILLIGYLSYFTPAYKYKQMVNAINALNASLVLLDTTTAIASRCLCLLGGILIVLLMASAEKGIGKLKSVLQPDPVQTAPTVSKLMDVHAFY